jgi:hypothetical protein
VERPSHHLAQVNVGRVLEPIDSPRLAEFVAALEPINGLADSTPGFVWRLQDEAGDATSFRPFEDDMILVNMSVWESFDALANFVYKGPHTQVMRRRREWFEHLKEAYTALWWIPAGELPSLADARARLEHLRENGPTEFAFGFRRPFPPPHGDAPPALDGAWLCPA